MDNYAKKISSEKETHLIDIEYNIIIRNTYQNTSKHVETHLCLLMPMGPSPSVRASHGLSQSFPHEPGTVAAMKTQKNN